MRRAFAWAALALAVALPVRAADFSYAAFDTVLTRHLHGGRVNYGALAKDRGPLDRFLAATRAARPDDWPRAAQIAFWVNAYNARVLDGVVRRPGLESVLDVGRTLGIPTLGFFKEKFSIAGGRRSLDDIEHGILRARFHEPRVHFVVNCASASCPELPAHPLQPATLDRDLEAATRRFLADTTRNRIDPARALRISSIFKWYGDDFRAAAGSVPAFIAAHWPGPGVIHTQLPVRYLDYDWKLNGSW